MTAILFCDGSPNTEAKLLLDQLQMLDKRFVWLLIDGQGTASEAPAIPDADGEIARLFGAQPGTLYLLRPDLHIAGRWKAIVPDEILRTARICLGKQTP
jgi:3-(3-hydroxy-phenyl)propionate hydroxylase